MDGWVDGWVDGKAGLRIAYSNQKFYVEIYLIFREKEIVPRMAVYYAPRTEHTSFVFVEQVLT